MGYKYIDKLFPKKFSYQIFSSQLTLGMYLAYIYKIGHILSWQLDIQCKTHKTHVWTSSLFINKQHQWYITDKHFLSLSTENPIFIYEFHQWHDEIRFFLKKWLFVKTLPWISFCLRNSIIIVQFNSYYCYLIDIDVLLGWGFQ